MTYIKKEITFIKKIESNKQNFHFLWFLNSKNSYFYNNLKYFVYSMMH